MLDRSGDRIDPVLGQLVLDAPRTPAGILSAQFAELGLDLGPDLVRAVWVVASDR